MDKLKRIIGPAPSEQTPEEFREKLRLERRRVAEALESYRTRAQPSRGTRKPKVPKIPEAIQRTLKELGVTLEEYKELRKEFEREKADETKTRS